MIKVMIIDDEPRYRERLCSILSKRGYAVTAASDPKEALSLGIKFKPDVLVTDWMLKSEVHGLDAARALRAIHPNIQVILITGYCSADIKKTAQEEAVFALLEKPFQLTDLCSAVDNASMSASPRPVATALGVFEIDSAGSIINANERARELFAVAMGGSNAENLDDLFEPETIALFDNSHAIWIETTPLAAEGSVWAVYSRSYDDKDTRLFMFYPKGEEIPGSDLLACLLFGVRNLNEPVWPLDVRVLLLAEDENLRRKIVAHLQHTGCFCHAADNIESGIGLFQRDPGIGIVLFNCDGVKPADLQKLTSLRSNVLIVDLFGDQIGEQFSAYSMECLFKEKWSSGRLIQALSQFEAGKHRGRIFEPATGKAAGVKIEIKETPALPSSESLGIICLNSAGDIIDSNPAARELLGYSETELREMRAIDMTDLEDLEDDSRLFKELIGGKRNYYRLEKRCFNKNGEAFTCQWMALALPSSSQSGTAFIGILEKSRV